MLEFLGSGLFGGILGAIARLVPEFIKFFDKKNEREHELNMFKLQTDLEKVRGEFKVEEKYVDFSTAQMQAIGEAMKQQGEADSRAYKWVASLSALVRPAVTYILFGLYVLFKISMVTYAMYHGAAWQAAFGTLWNGDDFAMLNMILSFWFVGRAVEKYQRG